MKKRKRLTIPEIRTELTMMAAGLETMHTCGTLSSYSDISDVTQRIRELAEMTRRVYVKKRAPYSSCKVTPSLKRAILATYHAHPRWSVQKIANKYKTNQGRVSEIIGGKK